MASPLNLVFAERNFALQEIAKFYGDKTGYSGREPKIVPADWWARLEITAAAGLPVGNYSFGQVPRGATPAGSAVANNSWDTAFVKPSEMNDGVFFLAHGIQMKWFGGPLTASDYGNIYSLLNALFRVRFVENIELELPFDFIPNGVNIKADTGQFGNYGERNQETFWFFSPQVMVLQPEKVITFELDVLQAIPPATLLSDCHLTMRLCGEKVLPLT